MNSYQYEDFQSPSNSFLVGMMWRVAIGAVAGLFLAPRRGAELRGQMADSMNRAGRRPVDTYNRASETVNDMAGRAANIAENLSDRATQLTAKLNQSMSQKTSAPIS